MKILFIVSDFDLGGITSSLRNLSDLLIKKGFEVNILNLAKGEMPPDFNEKIKLVELQGRARWWNLSMRDARKVKGINKIKLLLIGLFKKALNKTHLWYKFIFKKCFWQGYDIAIGFRQSPLCFYIAKSKTDARLKVGFWHGDIASMGDVSSWMHYAYGLDKLACVSKAVADGVENSYPLLKGKTCVVYNVFDDDKINTLSLQPFSEFSIENFNIVTIARIDFEQKKIDWIPDICKKLKEDGLNFCWYIVGDGVQKKELENLIKSNKLCNQVVLCGNKSNPYPYIKHANLLVSLSKESYGMAIMESLICGTPVVAANYPALPEILTDGSTGLFALNSAEGVYRVIKRVLQDKELYKNLKENCLNYKYNRETIWNQFLGMVSE